MDIVSVAPPAVYPEPEDSPVVEYAVVVVFKSADDVNNAILKTWDVSALKSISASKRAILKDVVIPAVIAII